MALTKRTEFGAITILPQGQIQLRTDTVIDDDGAEVIRKYHRTVLEPGQDVSAYPAKVQQITAVVWTPAVVAAWRALLAAKNAKQAP